MNRIPLRRFLATIPALMLVVIALTLTASSLRHELSTPPVSPRANAAAIPEGMSNATIARDWQETTVSGTRRSR